MTDQELEARLARAIEIAREAGDYALAAFNDLGQLTVRRKGVQDMATEADVNTEALLRRSLAVHFPGEAFLGEESCDEFCAEPEQGVWVVDPIDGTQPFISNISSWCVALAYMQHNEVLIAVIYDPCREEMFTARLGGGCRVNGVPVTASPASSLAEGLVGMGYSTRVAPAATLEPMARLLASDGMFHRSGSGALSLAYVATGRLIGYFEPHMNAWDSVAGGLLVREAGGRTHPDIARPDVLENGCVVIAASAGVYDALEAVALGERSLL